MSLDAVGAPEIIVALVDVAVVERHVAGRDGRTTTLPNKEGACIHGGDGTLQDLVAGRTYLSSVVVVD